MAIRLYVEHILLCLSYVLFFTFITLDNVDYIRCFAICCGFHLIEKIHREEATFRKAKESHWIQTLQTLAPEGLNLELYAS